MEKRIRSPAYPSFGLPEALQRLEVLYREQHTHRAPRDVVAKHLGYNGLNGASIAAIAALNKYNLLEGRGEDLRVSDLAMKYLHPHSAQERFEAIREAASTPALFKELAERFPDRVPSDEILKNYLIRSGFSQSAVGSVVAAYRETVELVERESSFAPKSIELPGELHPAGATAAADEQVQSDRPAAIVPAAIHTERTGERTIIHYGFESGGAVRVAVRGEVETEEALSMLETLVEIKRRELERMRARKAHQEPEQQ